MNIFLLNFIIYTILWLYFFLREKRFNFFMIAWSCFTISALMSFLAIVNDYYYYSKSTVMVNKSILPLACLLLTNLIISLPIRKVDERRIDLRNISFDMPFFKTFVSFNLFFYTIISIMKAYEALAINTVSSYVEIYEMMNDEESTTMLRDILYSAPILRFLSGVGGNYCPTMAPLMIVYYFAKIVKSKRISLKVSYGIIVTLLPVVLQGVTGASRGMIFFSMFQLLFYYLIIKEYLPKKIKRFICIAAIGIVVGFAAISYVITDSRMETRANSKTINEDIMIYFGQPMLNVCYFHDKIKHHPMGARMLDIREKSGENSTFTDYWNYRTGAEMQLFKTYYGDVFIEFGSFAFLFIILYTLLWNKIVLKNFYKPMFIPFLWFYFHTLIFAVFNFKKISFMNIWMIMLIWLCFLINKRSKKMCVSKKVDSLNKCTSKITQ